MEYGKYQSKYDPNDLSYKNIEYLLGKKKSRRGKIDKDFNDLLNRAKIIGKNDEKIASQAYIILIAAAQARVEGWNDKFNKEAKKMDLLEEKFSN